MECGQSAHAIRNTFRWSILAVSLVLIIPTCFVRGFEVSSNKEDRPNIVFFLVDDLGWTDVGFIQDQVGTQERFYETPNIDALAQRGIIFTNAYANAPNCAPSRACLMSGLWAPRHGIYTVGTAARGKAKNRQLIPVQNKTELDDSFRTLAESLQDAGYRTASMGKWHLGEDPVTQGFDVNIAGTKWGSPQGGGYFAPLNYPNLKREQTDACLTDELANSAIEFISQESNKPFFLYLTFYAVHTPLQGKPDLVEKYKSKAPTKHHKNPKYASMIETVDQNIGRVMQCLTDQEVDENTIVVFFSDNGGHGGATSNWPLRGAKGMLYEGGIRVPMCIHWPQQKTSPRVESFPIQGIDFYPTLLSMAGIKDSNVERLDGFDFSHVLKEDGNRKLPGHQGHVGANRDLFWHFPAYLEGAGDPAGGPFRTTPASCIRRGDWKLIRWYETNRIELYNLNDDLREEKNLVDENQDIASELTSRLDEWLADTEAFLPAKK